MILERLLELLFVFPLYALVVNFTERKWLADAQTRVGPKLIGSSGFLQPASDFIKTIYRKNYSSYGLKNAVFVVFFTGLTGSLLYLLPTNPESLSMENEYSTLVLFVVIVILQVLQILMSWSVLQEDVYGKIFKRIVLQLSASFVFFISIMSVAVRSGSFRWTDIIGKQSDFFMGLGLFSFFPLTLFEVACFCVSGMALFRVGPLFDHPISDKTNGVDAAIIQIAQGLFSYFFAVIFVAIYLGGWNLPFEIGKSLSETSREFLQLLYVLLKALLFSVSVKVLLQPISKMDADQTLALFWKYAAPGAVLTLFGMGVCQWMIS